MKSAKSTTEMREAIFDAIPRLAERLGRRPFYSEIAAEVGYKSKASVHDRIQELVEVGRLERRFLAPETLAAA